MTDKKDYQAGKRDQNDSSIEDRTDKVGSGRSIGRGMDAPDSTQVVQNTSTAEPDPRARGEGALPPGPQSNAPSSSQSNSQSSQQSNQQSKPSKNNK